MKRIFTQKITLVLIAILCSLSMHGQKYSKVKIYTDNEGLRTLAEMGVAVDHGHLRKNTFFISDFSEFEIELIQQSGFRHEILIDDVSRFYAEQNTSNIKNNLEKEGGICSGTQQNPIDNIISPSNFELGSMGGYYTYAEFLDDLDAMATAYPGLISAKAPISTFQTFEGRPVYHVKISNNPNTDDGDPYVLYSAIHHAREPASLSQTMYFMWYLLENYGSDDEVTYLVDHTQLLFVPVINPDGYIYNETTDPNGGGMWRKNRRNHGNGTYGVDLNRNYSYGWNTTGVSNQTDGETYPGTAPFSEPETQAMKWLNEQYTIKLALNAHTYGNTLLYPVGTTAEEFAEHHDYFADISGHMCEHNNYFPQKSSGLYPASGDSDDYMYKVDIGVGNKDSVFAMTPEIGETGDGFWPAANKIESICKEMLFTNMVLSHLAHRYALVRDLDPSTLDNATGVFSHSIKRLGLEDGTITVSIQPISGLASVGNPIQYDLNIREEQSGTIAYSVLPDFQPGSEIVYELLTDNGTWVRRDTIRKTFGTPTLQFADDAATTGNWIGDWALTGEEFFSPSKSFTDSPMSNYEADDYKIYKYHQTIDLTEATAAMVRFYAKWDIEPDWDYAAFEISSDNGNSWTQLCGQYTNPGVDQTNWQGQSVGIQPVGFPIYDGIQSEWVLEEIYLNDYLGEMVQLRFVLHADGGVQEDGFYFDDFQLLYNLTDETNGITENETSSISLFPNPANEYAILDFGQQLGNGSVAVYSATGQLIKMYQPSGTSKIIEIKTADFPQGIYTIIYTDHNESRQTKRLVVIH